MSLTYAYAGELVKTEKTPDGDLLVYGKATGPDLDLDEQICDPKWLKTAMPGWAEWANVREQHTAIAAGVGVETVEQGDDWFVKALVTDKSTAHKVETGTLKGYSVGIRNARLVKDAGAPGGRIVGGEIVEISLVDRPCNPTAKLAIAKAAGAGLEPVDANGKALGDPPAGQPGVDLGEDVLADGTVVKAVIVGDVVPQATAPVVTKDSNTSNPGNPPKPPKGKKQKEKMNRYGALPSQAATGDGGDPNVVAQSANGPLAAASPFGGTQPMPKAAEPEVEKRDFTAAQRRESAASGHAMKDGSFPIENGDDLSNAIDLAGNAKNPNKARKHIMRQAARLGMSDQIPDTWKLVTTHKVASLDHSIADAIKVAVTEATKGLEAQLKAAQDQLAKVASTPIPGGPVLISTSAVPREQESATKAAQYRAIAAQSPDPSVAAAYRARAAELERAA